MKTYYARLLRGLKIVKTLGLYGLVELYRAKVEKDEIAKHIAYAALKGEAVRRISHERFLWRGRVFHVPSQLIGSFFSVLAELWTYRFAGRYNTVIDIGGFLGEVAWYFLTEGFAGRIVVYEPIFYDYAVENIGDVAVVKRLAVGDRYGKARFRAEGTRSRFDYAGSIEVDVIPLSEVLVEGSAVKMDCEGCETAILSTPCCELRKVVEWIIEIHPIFSINPIPIMRKMMECGYDMKIIVESPATKVIHFYKL